MAKRIFKNSKVDVVVTNDSGAIIVSDIVGAGAKEVNSAELITKQEDKEIIEQVPATKPESTWEENLIVDLNESIRKFLPISKQAGWSVKYINPVAESYENGTVKLDEHSYIGATMYIQFDFDREYKNN